MCGIAAIVNVKGEVIDIKYRQLFNMLNSELEHRGPDSSEIVEVNQSLIISHNRLSINGLTNGAQPFVSEKSVSSINGEIYNYRKMIHQHNLIVSTNSDCEVLHHILPNLNVLEDITGMFAFIHYCKVTKTLYFGRDFYGEKPLFYARVGDYMIICSEQKPLIRFLRLGISNIDYSSLIEYFLLGYNCADRTLFSEIKSCIRGTIYSLVLNSDLKLCKFWPKPLINLDLEMSDHLENTTISDVAIAMGLSGGVDSTYIACSLSSHIDTAYCVGYESSGGEDEIDEARSTADYLGINFKPIVISNDRVIELFKLQASKKDSLILDFAGIGYYAIYEQAHADGFKVCLMGHGGDEISFGYNWLKNSYEAICKNHRSFFYETLGDFRYYIKNNSNLMAPDCSEYSLWEYLPTVQLDSSLYSKCLQTAAFDYWLEPNSLRMGDSLSMSCSVEARHPLLYNRLINASSLEFSQSIYQKQFLKKCIKETNPQLLQRRKKHFAQPYMAYYSLLHNELKRDTLLPEISLLNRKTLDLFYTSSSFEPNLLTYYYYAKMATLDVWLKSL